MRRLALPLTAAAATLILAACGDQPTSAPEPIAVPELTFRLPPGCNPLQSALLTAQLFARYPVKNVQAGALLNGFLTSIGAAPRHDVEQKLLLFTKFTLDSYYAGYLSDPNGSRPPTTAEGVSLLINGLYACASLTGPGDLGLDKTGSAKVIGAEGGSVKATDAAGVEQAGLLVRAGSVSENVLFTVRHRPDKEGDGETAQTCVNTTWKIHGQCIQFETTPFVREFPVPVQVVVCDRAPTTSGGGSENDDDHDEVALIRDPHPELGEEGTQVFLRSPTELVLNCTPSGRIGMRNRLQPLLGDRAASLLASAVSGVADALTPKLAYAFDGLGSNTRLALSLWTVAHVEVTANGRVVRNDPDGEIGLPDARVQFIKTGSEEGDPVPEGTTDEDGRYSIGGLPTGFYQVLVTKEGFTSASLINHRIGIHLAEGKQTPEPVELESIVLEPAARPDFIISQISHTPTRPAVTDEVSLSVTVQNVGDGAAGASNMEVDPGFGDAFTISVPALAPSESFTATRTVRRTTDDRYIATATADAGSLVAESNEENNQAAHPYFVFFISGSVTDVAGDALTDERASTNPDLVSASVSSAHGEMIINVGYAPGTYDANTESIILLDTDQNPATGIQGTRNGTDPDDAVIGSEYFIQVIGTSVTVRNSSFSLLGTGTASVDPDGDGTTARFAISLMQPDDGRINFKVLVDSQLRPGAFTGVLDDMTNTGQPPAVISIPD